MTPMDEQTDIKPESKKDLIVTIKGFPSGDNRIKTVIDLSSAHNSPNISLSLIDSTEQEVSQAVIMETFSPHIEFTLHIRKPDALYPLRLVCTLYKEDNQSLDSKSIQINQTAQQH